MYKRVLVGTDLSETAEVATARAAQLCSRLDAELVVIHAGRDGSGVEEIAEKHGGRGLAVSGAPADVLVSQAEAQDADLIVVGSVGMSGARRFVLGNVPNKVSHHAPTDVLIVKTDTPRSDVEFRKILVGTDGSPTAMRAVDMAAELAQSLGAGLNIVCVYEPPSEQELQQLRADPADPVAQWNVDKDVRGIPEEFRWRIAGETEAEDVLERSVEHAAKVGVNAEAEAIRGNPAEELIAYAKRGEFDLIAVGSVGMSGAKRFMLGNVPHRISHHAPTDVLILRTA